MFWAGKAKLNIFLHNHAYLCVPRNRRFFPEQDKINTFAYSNSRRARINTFHLPRHAKIRTLPPASDIAINNLPIYIIMQSAKSGDTFSLFQASAVRAFNFRLGEVVSANAFIHVLRILSDLGLVWTVLRLVPFTTCGIKDARRETQS